MFNAITFIEKEYLFKKIDELVIIVNFLCNGLSSKDMKHLKKELKPIQKELKKISKKLKDVNLFTI